LRGAPPGCDHDGGIREAFAMSTRACRRPLVCLCAAFALTLAAGAAAQVTPDPVLMPGAVPRDPALMPGQTSPAPVRMPDAVRPDPAPMPQQSQGEPVRFPDAVRPDRALMPRQSRGDPALPPTPADSLAPLPPIFPPRN
jgi:hypothetical protein